MSFASKRTSKTKNGDMRNLMMMFFVLLYLHFGHAQGSSMVRIHESSSDETEACYDIQILFKGEPASLASQNYRIFYNAKALIFLEDKSQLHLSSDLYTYNVVQHLSDVDASGVGPLKFEGSLGFINTAVILNDRRSGAASLKDDSQWKPVMSLCFSKTGTDTPEIVLARKSLTAPYGRAFVELSQVNSNGEISSLQIDDYIDIVK